MTAIESSNTAQQEILNGIKRMRAQKHLNDKIPNKSECLALLNAMNFAAHIINHQVAVMRQAMAIAHNIVHGTVDVNLIRAGALLHDIGRFRSHELIHTTYGGDILPRIRFSGGFGAYPETHSMGGLTPEEAIELGLPARDYQPRSLEEKIVCLSDKYLSGTEVVTIEQRFARWIEKFGNTEFLQEQIRRVKAIEEEILHLIHD